MLLPSRSAAIIGVLVLVLLSSHRPRDDVDADSFARCKNTTARAVAAPYDLTGRCIVITGGDSGLGFAASTALAASNADVIICSHNPAKGLQQAARIRRETNRTVRVVGMDLKRLASVRSAALQIIEMCDGQLDVLLANAGISETNDNHPVTSDGFDDIYQVGALGHTLLVEMLLPSLRRARGRVVYTSGAAAFYACMYDYDVPRFANGSWDLVNTNWDLEIMNARTDDMQRMDEQTKARLARRQAQAHACITVEGYKKAATARATLSFWRSGGAHNGHASGERLIDDGKRLGIFRYGLAKFTQVLQAAELAKREESFGVTAYSVDPGVVATSIWTCAGSTGSEGWPLNRHCGIASDLNMTEEAYQKKMQRMAKWLEAPTAEFGAATITWLAAAPMSDALARANGRYFVDCRPSGSVWQMMVADIGEAAATVFRSRIYDINRAWAFGGPDAVV